MKLKEFIKKYRYIIFDMDGVITSEQNYWTIAALTVHEMIDSGKYFGKEDFDPQRAEKNAAEIRAEVFCSDRIIYRVKNIGINSNWDLAYVTAALKMEFGSYEGAYLFLSETEKDVDALYKMCAEIYDAHLECGVENAVRNARLWQMCVSCFQEWYLGDEGFYDGYGHENGCAQVQTGKTAMKYREVPLVDNEKLKIMFECLRKSGIHLGIATGRPQQEMMTPLKMWDMEKYFDKNRMISYTYVIDDEKKYSLKDKGMSLTKPHPYMFVRSALGEEYSSKKVIDGDYRIGKDVLFVGDAGADILAAKRAGADFLAVLTGAMGKNGRPFFEKNGAEYILDSITDILE